MVQLLTHTEQSVSMVTTIH